MNCPHCGYCSQCGRRNSYQHYQWYYPYYQSQGFNQGISYTTTGTTGTGGIFNQQTADQKPTDQQNCTHSHQAEQK